MGYAFESSNKRKEAPEVTVEAPAPAKDRMSGRVIMWILSRKSMPMPECSEISALDLNPDLMEATKEDDDEYENLPKLRKWLREELASRGYVEMYDYCTRRRDEIQELIDEGWKQHVQPKLDELQLSDSEIDWDDDGEDSDEDVLCCHAVLRKQLSN